MSCEQWFSEAPADVIASHALGKEATLSLTRPRSQLASRLREENIELWTTSKSCTYIQDYGKRRLIAIEKHLRHFTPHAVPTREQHCTESGLRSYGDLMVDGVE